MKGTMIEKVLCVLVSTVLLFGVVWASPKTNDASNSSQIQYLRDHMDYYQKEFHKLKQQEVIAEWTFQTNTTKETTAERVAAAKATAAWLKAEWASNITRLNLSILNPDEEYELDRLYRLISVLGVAALDEQKHEERTKIVTDMTSLYGSATICPYEKQDCDLNVDKTWTLEQEMETVFRTSNAKEDYDKLAYVWKAWRDATGRKLRDKFIRYVQLTNEAAKANDRPDIKDGGDLWLEPYQSPDIKDQVAELFEELKPFYQEIHAFVRHKLRQRHGEDRVDADGLIPAHLLGNMWSQKFDEIFPIVSEFSASAIDVTEAMKQRNFTPRKMFDTSDEFYKKLGLIGLEEAAPNFYNLSIIEKPTDGRKMVCHATAWDLMKTFSLPGDFRIKMCTVVGMKDFITVHHEMGHTQYYFQYVNLPFLFRRGANPGFHEAIGDTLALSVATPKHLKAIGLLDKDFLVDQEAQLAFLLRMALDKIAFLPYGYIMDLYAWSVFNGSVPFDKLNAGWWDLREEYQGISAPVPRSEEDFDPGAKFHVVKGVPYMRYFVARFLQFSFHQALCEAAGQFDPSNPDVMPLHECDIAGSLAAGDKLKKLLQAGRARPWTEILQEMTGSPKMSAQPMLNYFQPLRAYLKEYIVKNNLPVGWKRKSEKQEDKSLPRAPANARARTGKSAFVATSASVVPSVMGGKFVWFLCLVGLTRFLL